MTLDPTFDDTYTRLAAAWSHHEELRTTGAAISELVASRGRLDALRLTAARLRSSAAQRLH